MLNYGVKHGYLVKNPALLVEPIKRPRQSVKVLPIDVIELMLKTAEVHTPSICCHSLTISLFCGVRPEELGKIRVEMISKRKSWSLERRSAKRTSTRHVDLKDNMIEWLALLRSGRGQGQSDGRDGPEQSLSA